jgi:hypothetical protein
MHNEYDEQDAKEAREEELAWENRDAIHQEALNLVEQINELTERINKEIDYNFGRDPNDVPWFTDAVNKRRELVAELMLIDETMARG